MTTASDNIRLLQESGSRELAEALEQQRATSEILHLIASSPADVQPVVNAVAESAARLCEAVDAFILRVDGQTLRPAAHYGSIPVFPEEGLAIDRDWVTGRAVLDRRTLHVHDLSAEAEEFPLGHKHAQRFGFRTILCTPLLREGTPLGVIVVRRTEVCPFTEKQIKLLETFADQAAIAIENVRLFQELQARNRDLSEALEQQTATSEILRVIAASPADTTPVFETIVRNAVSLCGSLFANVFRFDGELLHFVASYNVGRDYVAMLQSKYPMRPDVSQVSGRVLLTKAVVRLEDVLVDPDYDQRFPRAMAWRRMLGVPMLREGNPLGAIVVGWAEPGPVPRAQEELLKTFADQAAIAIENVRLFNQVQAQARRLETQTVELAQWNTTLEQRVQEQLGQLERLGRLKRFFSPQLADLIVAGGAEDPLRSHRREVTVVFLDLRGFTGFAESTEPEEVMSVLREYHAAMGELVLAHEGTLERFTGDGMMVFFNDPVPVPNPAERAIRMALAMRQRVDELAAKWRRRGDHLDLGVGIAQGYATIGAIGFEGRWDYGAIGTVTNLAARLCGEAKPGQILAAQRVLATVEDLVEIEAVGELALRGFQRPVAAYNVLRLRAPR